MKIVIAGSNGFIGQNLLEYFGRYKDIDVYEFNSDNHTDPGRYYIDANDFLAGIPPDIDYLVNLGARLGAVPDHECGDMSIFHSNASAARNIAALCRNQNIKLIHFSSSAAIKPTCLYGWSQYMAERFVWDIMNVYDQCTFRLFNVYGEDEPTEGVNPSIYTKIKQKWHIPIYSPCERDFIHVEDVCRAVYHITQKEFQPGIYDLGTGEAVSIQKLYETINGHTPNTMVTPNNVPTKLCADKSSMLKGYEPWKRILSWHEKLGE